MTDTKIYTGYVAYYIRNLGQSIPDSHWVDLLHQNLGKVMSKVTDKTWKTFALKLYYIHYIGLSLRLDTEDLIASDKKPAELREILEGINEFRETNDLGELDVVYYLPEKDVIEHMKNFYAPETVIDEVFSHSEKKKPATKTKTATAKAPKTTKTTKSTSTAKTAKATSNTKTKTNTKAVAKTSTKAPAKIPAFLLVKQGKKTVTLTKKEDIIKHLHGNAKTLSPSPAKPVKTTKIVKTTKASSTAKTCGSYSITELKKMAQEKEIAGRSKMNKAELCKALKIKD